MGASVGRGVQRGGVCGLCITGAAGGLNHLQLGALLAEERAQQWLARRRHQLAEAALLKGGRGACEHERTTRRGRESSRGDGRNAIAWGMSTHRDGQKHPRRVGGGEG